MHRDVQTDALKLARSAFVGFVLSNVSLFVNNLTDSLATEGTDAVLSVVEGEHRVVRNNSKVWGFVFFG